MSFSRWLDELFRPSTPVKPRKRRFRPVVETLEDRVVPTSIWVVGTIQDDGTKDSLRYILVNDAKAGDLVVFADSLTTNATGNSPAVISLKQNPAGLVGGPLIVPAGVNLVGPAPDTSRGYEQPLIEISGANLSNVAPGFTQDIIQMSGTTSAQWPDGGISGGINGFTTQQSPGPNQGGGTGDTVVAFLAFSSGKANQSAVNFTGGDFSFLDDCTVLNNASVGIVNTGAANAYVTRSFVTDNGTGAGSAPEWGGLLNQPGTQTTAIFSTFSNNVSTATKFGGGLTNHSGSLYIEDSTLDGNRSSYGGGGVLTTGGNLVLHSATIADNQTGAKGGGIMLNGGIGKFIITNTLDAANVGSSGSPTYNDIYEVSGTSIGSFFSRFNLIGVNPTSDVTFTWDANTILGTVGNPINRSTPTLLLGHLAPNGGPTETVALLAGSMAIDKGDNLPADASENFYSWDDSVSSPIPINIDQTLNTRFYNGRQDIGAYEYEQLATISITPTSLPAAKPGSLYDQLLTASGGNGNGYTFQFVNGTNPSWLSISTNLSHQGVLSGTPPANFVPATFQVTATDSSGNTTTQSYTITAGGLVITPGAGALPTAIVGQAYNQTITVVGGTGPYTMTETGLPAWATWTPNAAAGTATITGTPLDTTGSPFTVTVTVVDSSSPTNSLPQVYTLTVNPALSLTPASGALSAVVEGNPYTASFVGAGGTGTGYTYTYAGTLPTGLTLNASTGQLTGTDSTPADVTNSPFSFTVTVTDSGGNKITNSYTITVEGPITVSPTTLPNGTDNNAYNQTIPFTATGGSGTGYTYAVTSGALPTGMLITASAPYELSGTPTQYGTFSFTITATDSVGGTGSQNYTITINPPLVVSPTTVPLGVVGSTYTSTILTPSGGSGSGYTMTEVGNLDGLTFNPATGLLSGTPSGQGPFNFTINITDSIGATGSQQFTLNVNPALTLTPPTLPTAAALNGLYSQTFVGSGGSGTYVSYTESGPLPSGITFSNGVLSGTATGSTGSFPFTVTVTDSLGDAVTNNYTLVVESAITFSPASLPLAPIGQTYNQGTAITASGGSGSGYALTETGSIPGLTYSNGTFTGMPTQAGTFNFTISATDGAGGTGSQNYTLTVDPALALTPAAGALQSADLGSLYTVKLSTTGGSGTGYTYSASGLPAWLTLSGSQLTGTPTTQGPVSFSITVTDSAGGTTTNSYTLTVNPPLTIGPATLPATAQGDTYYFPLVASGGTGTGYTYTITSGAAPVGVGFSGNVLTGQVISVPNSYSFTVTLTDSVGGSINQSYTIAVTAPVSITSPTTLPTGTLGNVYPSTTFTPTGGSGTPYTYSETGALPAGLTFNGGTLAGTPTQSGTFHIVVSATDGKGGTGTQTYTLTITFSLGTSKNDKFVQAVYEQLLKREPDPGAVGWVTYLNNGGVPSRVVSSVESSTEYLADVVTGIYQHYLGRNPDAGAAGWVNALASGATIESVTASILSSAEYYADKGSTNTKFVQGLYQDILGRAADTNGLNAWVAFLNAGGSRYQAALSFLTSTEYHTDLVAGSSWLMGYYPQFLERSADLSGLSSWVQALQSGVSDQAVLAAIFGSAEGYNLWSVKG